MTVAEVLILARRYSQVSGLSLTVLSVRACGNDSTLHRLAAGRGCHSATLQRAANWFGEHWPKGEPWPVDTPRRLSGAATRPDAGDGSEAPRDCGA